MSDFFTLYVFFPHYIKRNFDSEELETHFSLKPIWIVFVGVRIVTLDRKVFLEHHGTKDIWGNIFICQEHL